MRPRFFSGVLSLLLALIAVPPAFPAGTGVLKARVTDLQGVPLAGAKLFLYDSSNVRRPADFISPLSDSAGQVRIVLPPGRYWAIARHKADGKYGPLLPGDRHSGEPLEIDLAGDGADAEFVVADLRELGQKKRTGSSDVVRVRGRVVDAGGVPVSGAYVHAGTNREFSELPEYISAWTGGDGEYELYLPAGKGYFAGASRQFPPVAGESGVTPFDATFDKIDIAMDITLTVK